MGRIIALAVVSAVIWWLWKRWQNKLPEQQSPQQKQPQKLAQCVRCDAMLPSNTSDRKEVAQGCEHGDRCPLKLEQD